MHGAPPSARELRSQQGPNYRVGWGIKAAAEHLQGPTHPTPRRARRSGKGVYSGGTACANADTRRGCFLRKLEGALGAWRGRREGRLQGQLSGRHRPPAKECGPHHTRRLRALRPRSSIRLYTLANVLRTAARLQSRPCHNTRSPSGAPRHLQSPSPLL